ncbi:MAG: F0F1 ATP synthase subunit delta [Kordiimonadaceae bacterium]|nr:F0F1 ATP synthase subunit delta [Kordiimonadaceae bacterium]MBT6035974.1 F0F1 ATP synthase subunit delta [Kordiimonadaceae bacterium]
MASENITLSGLAGRYAVALFELAVEEKNLDNVAEELTALGELLKSSDELKMLTTSPIISRANQAAAMSAMVKAAGFSKTVENFIGVVTANRRLDQLANMINEFNRMLSHHRGEVNASVVTAYKLDNKQLDALSAKLKSMVGSDVNLESDVDEELLGGMVVRVGSKMIDSSLKTKLANLEATMKEVG